MPDISFWQNKLYRNESLVKLVYDREVSGESYAIPFPPIVFGGDRSISFYLLSSSNLFVVDGSLLSDGRLLVTDETITLPSSFPNFSDLAFYNPYRTFSFLSSDQTQAFLAIETGATIIAIDVSRYILYGETTIESSAVNVKNELPLYFSISPGVSYVDGDTFIHISRVGVATVWSFYDRFSPLQLNNVYRLSFQSNGLTMRQPIAFPSTLTSNSLPQLIFQDGSNVITQIDNGMLPITSPFACALSPGHIGYDFIITLPSNSKFLWADDLQRRVIVGDWIRDETNWLRVMDKNNQQITSNIPAEAVPVVGTLAGKSVSIKSLSSANPACIAHYYLDYLFAGGSYQPTYYKVNEGMWLIEPILETAIPLLITAEWGYTVWGNSVDGFSIHLSSPTFWLERGSWLVNSLYQPYSNEAGRVAIWEILHPQFWSKYFASVPAMESVGEEGKFAIFTLSVRPPRRKQTWRLDIVSTRDPFSKYETVADMASRQTASEVWEFTYDGSNWYQLSEGEFLKGDESLVRLRIPRAVLEWKTDVFKQKYPNEPYRFVFVSQSVEVSS